ncbi:MAG: hypothetical protein CMJ23_14455 [Phycisphaerae bacterium]|nr:hypothetical protein [Phycisphaerae bacterium]
MLQNGTAPNPGHRRVREGCPSHAAAVFRAIPYSRQIQNEIEIPLVTVLFAFTTSFTFETMTVGFAPGFALWDARPNHVHSPGRSIGRAAEGVTTAMCRKAVEAVRRGDKIVKIRGHGIQT